MSKPKLTLYYDIVSPFGYIAYYMLRHSTVFKQCDVHFQPIFLGGIMKACGNRPPIEIKNKDKWINLERLRWARLFDVPITKDMPDGFPVLTLNIQRALTALSLSNPGKVTAASDAFYHAFWVDRNEGKVDKPEGMTKVLSSVLGDDEAKKIMEKSQTNEIKQTLNTRSQEAVDLGAFGIPYFVATNTKGETECFWGFDHLGQVCYHLGLERPQVHTGPGWQAML